MKRWLMLVTACFLIFSLEGARKEKKASVKDKQKSVKKKQAEKYAAPAGWLSGISSAQNLARQKNMPLLIVITAPEWQQSCRNLDKNVLRNSSFQKYLLKKVVPVYIQVPRGKPAPEVAAELKKCSFFKNKYPCTALVSPALKLLAMPSEHSVNGYTAAIHTAVRKMPKK